MRVPIVAPRIVALALLCAGVYIAPPALRADAQEPAATATATATQEPEATPASAATPAPQAPATPTPVESAPVTRRSRADRDARGHRAADVRARGHARRRPPTHPRDRGRGTRRPNTRAARVRSSRAPARRPRRRRRPPAPRSAVFSPATLGRPGVAVPNFFIDRFRIPPFLLPIYQAAGTQYGIRWEVLAAINEIETDYGRNLDVSSAGALGWMQFMPDTWKQYGVDANRDGVEDPFNPVDAIFASARYLRAAGADRDLRRAIFAYNHADWYVDSVLLRARVVGGLPSDLVGALTGLTQGRFPVRARSTYTGRLGERAGAPAVASTSMPARAPR